jgi:VanZ family protein
MKDFLKFHLPAILYAMLIIGLSSLSHLNLPRVKSIQVDKVLHFIEYAIFAVLVFRSFSHFPRRLSSNIVALLAFLAMAAFALGDETYQSFVPGRHRDPLDYTADLAGAAAVLLILWTIRRKKGLT